MPACVRPQAAGEGVFARLLGRSGGTMKAGRDARLARFRLQSTFKLPSPRRRLLADSACNAYNKCMQYTIRGIPAAVDTALRERARSAGMSLNEAAVDALAEGSGMAGSRRKRRDLGDIAKTWKAEKAVAAALADQDRVDEDLWR